MSAHTHGPWQARGSHQTDDFGIIAQDGSADDGGWMVIAECFSDLRRSGERAIEEAAANARLIAAAPDLLEALKRCRFDSLNMSLADLEFCGAAIAKATGQKGDAS